MNQSAAAQGDTYQAAHYNAAAPPPIMYSGQPLQPPSYSGQPLQPPSYSGQPLQPPYSGQPLQPPSYSGQPLQPPPMAATAPPAAWSYPPQAAYEAANGCKSAPQAYSDPRAAGAYPQSCAPAFYPGQAYYQPPQQSVNVAVSTAPSVAIVHQPPPVTTMVSVVKSYLAWSLVSLIVLCWPLGIPALIYSLKVKSATTLGDKSKYSLMARNFNIAATVVGPLLILILASSMGTVRTYSTYYYTYYYYYG